MPKVGGARDAQKVEVPRSALWKRVGALLRKPEITGVVGWIVQPLATSAFELDVENTLVKKRRF